MATIIPMPNGKFRVQVYVNKQRKSKVLRTRREAQAWGASMETEIRNEIGKKPGELKTLRQLLERYRDEVTPSRRGQRFETLRINAMLAHPALPIELTLSDIGPDEIKPWRDARLRVVKPGTLLREIGILGSIFEHARVEWRWIAVNPVRDVKRPARPVHRKVVFGWRQIRAQLRAMGYRPRRPIRTMSQSSAVVFMTALRTGIRAGELCALRWSDVKELYCSVREGKTEAATRDVPLTWKARRLLDKMADFDEEFVFGLHERTLDALFRRYRDRAGQEGYVFHDSRHTAATWMVRSRKGEISVLELCKIFGWTDPKMAMVYFNPTPEDLLKRIEVNRPAQRSRA